MKKIIIFIFHCCYLITFSQTHLKKGHIIDSIPVENTSKETYALYLPKAFNEKEISPIVFIFDPSAKGTLGIQPFIKAAEKYNYILVCSNNSKNGPYNKNFDIFNSLFSHIVTKFKIKESEMYLSGFSGGSRLACAIASLTDLFTGVIACGAGFPQIPEYMPSSQNYSYVGLCGNRDFNYNEMIVNKNFLDKANFNNTLITHNDKHSWPNEDMVLKAFDWLYLQKLKEQKNDDIDSDELTKLYQRDYDLILNYQKNNELVFAYENYERLLKSYAPFFKLDSIKTKFNTLKKSKDYKKQLRSLSTTFKTETEITNKLLEKFDIDLLKPNDKNLEWWKGQLNKLKKLENTDNLDIKNMVYRIKFNVYVTIFSTKKFYTNEINSLQHSYIKNLLKLFRLKNT